MLRLLSFERRYYDSLIESDKAAQSKTIPLTPVIVRAVVLTNQASSVDAAIVTTVK